MLVHLMGGLGNQLFIYAAALALSRRMQVPMVLDSVSAFRRDQVYRREYVLDQFSITSPQAPPRDHFVGPVKRLLWRCMLLLDQLGLAGPGWSIVHERSPAARLNARTLHFFGYWQSEDYFRECAAEVKREFRLRASLSAIAQSELAMIHARGESVAVGIRRFSDRPDPRLGYTTGSAFYSSALAEIARVLPHAHLFIVTDDAAWVRGHLRFPLPHTLVSHKTENRRAYENLVLMQACRHFVLGNSTYHWWGAWLGEKEGSRTLVDTGFAQRSPEFYPARWQQI